MIEDLGIIFAAGGYGSRYQYGNKLFEEIDGKPLFIHSIRSFSTLCRPENAVIAVPADSQSQFHEYLQKYLPDYPLQVVEGGSERDISVENGLSALNKYIKFVAIHDSARPLTSATLLLKCLEEARIYGGAIPGKPVTDTLKQVDKNGVIITTVPREFLWCAETPQVFERNPLEAAYNLARKEGLTFTDDAAAMEYIGSRVKIVFNCDYNPKITYRSDLTELRNKYPHCGQNDDIGLKTT